jgi:exopolysaccharide biosynthesis polyprenyl glycosylphosphotransferase
MVLRVAGHAAVGGHRRADQIVARLARQNSAAWVSGYLRYAAIADGLCGLAAGLVAFRVRFDEPTYRPISYLVVTLALPLIWLVAVWLAGGYDSRFIGVGSDEFRRIINAAVFLTAAVAIVAYATKTEIARGYVVLALPLAAVFDLLARFLLRKRLHKLRRLGSCMRRVVVVGHTNVISDLATLLRRETYHGLLVVAACAADSSPEDEIVGVPVIGDLENVPDVVERFEADTVAVLACPEMSGIRLRELAWALEKTNTDLCVAPALLDVAGPRTTIRPVAGMPLLHLDHPEFTGARRALKAGFDRVLALSALILAAPLMLTVAVLIRLADGGPALFRQTRVGKDGRTFMVYKFRTMVLDAEALKVQLAARNENDGALFKIRNDPRVTTVGGWLRRWSLDELPQLFNVLFGDMSLVGPRPALPEEAAVYGDHVRRRLVVKPGITGLWQVNGRSDLSWEESVRLDLRYVENWSFALDLQILWKTCSAVVRGSGAY